MNALSFNNLLQVFTTLIVVLIGVWLVDSNAHAQTSWYDPDWQYRKSHIIQGGVDAGTNYQKKIVVHYGSGTDSGKDVYCSGNCNNNFSDIRFTSDDGTTELDYWIQEKTNGNSATVWIEVKDDLDSNQQIFFYYGNSSATSESDGFAVFDLFDDFEDGTIDSNRWSQQNTCGGTIWEYDGVLEISGCGDVWQNADDAPRITAQQAQGDRFIAEALSDFPGSDTSVYDRYFGLRSGTADDEKMFTLLNDGNDSDHGMVWRSSVGASANYDNGQIPAQPKPSIAKFEVASDTVTSYQNGLQVNQKGFTDWNIEYPFITDTHNGGSKGSVKNTRTEWVRVRKFATTKPTHDSWGSQETQTAGDPELSSSNYSVVRSSINAGGLDTSNSANYQVADTVGEQATGRSTSSNYQVRAGYRQMSDSSIAITSQQDINLGSIGGVDGGSAEATPAMNVITDNEAGYELSVQASSSPAMQNTTAGGSFADYNAGTDPSYNFSVSASSSAFGFSPEGLDITQEYLDNGSSCNVGSQQNSSRCWRGFTTSDQLIAQSSDNNQPDGATTTLRLRAESGANNIQTAGTYEATITVTAVAI